MLGTMNDFGLSSWGPVGTHLDIRTFLSRSTKIGVRQRGRTIAAFPLPGFFSDLSAPDRLPVTHPLAMEPRVAGDQAIPSLNLQDLSVFFINMVMVMGPTPPGTGVMEPAISLAASKSTSPRSTATILLGSFALGFSPTRLTPTSMTQAPGWIHSGLTRPGTPAATMRISARLQ